MRLLNWLKHAWHGPQLPSLTTQHRPASDRITLTDVLDSITRHTAALRDAQKIATLREFAIVAYRMGYAHEQGRATEFSLETVKNLAWYLTHNLSQENQKWIETDLDLAYILGSAKESREAD